MNPHAAISREDEISINMLMIFSFMCTSANAKVRSDKSYNLLGEKNKRERKARVASGGGGGTQHLKTKKKEMVLTAECTVCFTFWLMHSHNLPTLFYCIYIWPHTQKYTDTCVESDPSTGPVHQTDILMDEAVSACVCCLSSSQMTLSVDHTHTHSMNLHRYKHTQTLAERWE